MNTIPIEFTKEWFEDSSKEWMKNKRKVRNTYYKYICQHTYKYGKKCGRDVYKDKDLCRQHWALFK